MVELCDGIGSRSRLSWRVDGKMREARRKSIEQCFERQYLLHFADPAKKVGRVSREREEGGGVRDELRNSGFEHSSTRELYQREQQNRTISSAVFSLPHIAGDRRERVGHRWFEWIGP